jgi:hypothetical protein
METLKIVKVANDTINSDEKIKEFYPYVKEVYIEPLETISAQMYYNNLKYDFGKCKFHIHLSLPFSVFYKSFIELYKLNYFKNKIMSPVDEFLYEKYQIDIAFMIDYYLWKALKSKNIFFDSNYKVDIYSSDGKEIYQLNKVFPK